MAEKSVDEELKSRNERQKNTIVDLTNELKTATKKLAEVQIWERFAGYLLDNCEGQTITEESLQAWLSDMLGKEKAALQGTKG